VLDAVLLALQFGQGLVDAFLRERVDFQAFDDLVLAVSQVTGKPNMTSLGMPYSPLEGMPMVTHLPLVPRAQSRMWSMAALAAEAADDRPRAAMMAAPRLPTVGRKVLAFQSWSLIMSCDALPLMVAKR
jgi:hypothetical protein